MLPAIFLLFCILVAIFRFIVGPTIPDRVVALDTVNTLVVSGMILAGAAFNEAIYIDVAIIYALLSYITTLFIAKHLENRRYKKQ
ncbi:MAG: cation:proton antiporter [Atribacterota bacterium]